MATKRTKDDVLPILGWRWRDWRASTARAAMSPLARGIYRELIDAHWAEKDCSLPDDDRVLAALAGVTPEVWEGVKAEILPWLPVNEKGRRQNARAYETWSEARAFRRKKRRAGSKGNATRWDKRTSGDDDGSHSDTPAIANDRHPHPSSPIPSVHSHPSEGSPEGIPSVGSPGGSAGRDGTDPDDAETLLLTAEPNHERQKPGPDGRARTLERGRTYLERLQNGLGSELAGKWLDATKTSNPSPGALLRFVAPSDFGALRAQISERLPSLRNADAYVRSALADRWVQVLARLACEARTRTKQPARPGARTPEPAESTPEAPERGHTLTTHVQPCPSPRPAWRVVGPPAWRRRRWLDRNPDDDA